MVKTRNEKKRRKKRNQGTTGDIRGHLTLSKEVYVNNPSEKS